MVEFSERTQANMDVVLEPTLGELMYTARRAIVQLEGNQRSAS